MNGPGFDLFGYAAAGMAAQRAVLNIDAKNVALSQTATPQHPVRELAPVFSTNDDDPEAQFTATLNGVFGDSDSGDDDDDGGAPDMTGMPFSNADGAPAGAMQVTGVKPGRAMSGSDAVTEMVGVLNAQRAYEADAAVFDTGKSLVSRTLQIEET